MSRTQMLSPSDPTEPKSASKRKRDIIPENEDDKLEIDVNLPEPPSKKAKRKEKKQSSRPSASTATVDIEQATTSTKNSSADAKKEDAASKETSAPKRSEHGIWIGNLPFSVTKDSLRQFLKDEGGIDDEDVTRVHLPSGEKGQNKGFAYVDVTTPAVLQVALTLSEKMIGGRRVLIKNAKSFEGRPEKASTAGTAEDGETRPGNRKEPSKRVFVGNLSFDVTKDELAEHFSQAGLIEDVFMATFQDTGKCKGFGWVRFESIEAAESAVKGFIYKNADDMDDAGSTEEDAEADEASKSKVKKSTKRRKYFINRIHGRTLRCEFAEDAQTRYKKRFGQKPSLAKDESEAVASGGTLSGIPTTNAEVSDRKEKSRVRKLDKDERREERRKRHDARSVAPGKALAGAQRATGAIVAGTGKKVSFD